MSAEPQDPDAQDPAAQDPDVQDPDVQDPDVQDAALFRGAPIVGFIRRDETRKILRILLPMMLPTALGALTIGYAYAQLDAIDPMGIQPRTARTAQHRGHAPPGVDAPHGVDAPRVDAPHGVDVEPERDGIGYVAIAPVARHRPGTVRRHDASLWWLFGLGLLLVVSGPGVAIWGLRRSWKDDAFLLLRVDALIHRENGETLQVPWDDVERVEWSDAPPGVRLKMRSGAPILIPEAFAGVSGPALAQQLEDIRRKASFGLLPQQRR